MKVSRQDPRANQKARTREALVAAAGALLRRGAQPTVAEAADEARVSRATAYRYFQTQQALLLEVTSLGPATAPIEEMLAGPPLADVEDDLLRLVDRLERIVLAEEVPMRSALRVYLETWLARRRDGAPAGPVREGRRMRWLDRVLAPARRKLPHAQWRRLRAALALVLGVEAVVVMKDVCRIDDGDDVVGVLRWAARTMLRGALSEGRAKGRRPRA